MATTDIEELFASTNTSLTVATKTYGSFHREQELKDTFHAAAGKLYLIEEALDTTQPNVSPEDVPQAITALLRSCKTTAAKIMTVFSELSKVQASERRECYVKLIQRKGRSYLVEVLVRNMMDYVRRIAENYETEDLQEQLTILKTEIDTLKSMSPSVPVEQQKGGHTITNNGGTQYNAMDNARQFNGNHFGNGANIY